jgi:hypothetical protein
MKMARNEKKTKKQKSKKVKKQKKKKMFQYVFSKLVKAKDINLIIILNKDRIEHKIKYQNVYFHLIIIFLNKN